MILVLRLRIFWLELKLYYRFYRWWRARKRLARAIARLEAFDQLHPELVPE